MLDLGDYDMNDMNVEMDKINEMLHYFRAEPFSKTLQELTSHCKTWCPFSHGKRIKNDCYKAHPGLKNVLAWINKFIVCSKFLDCNRYTVDSMSVIYSKLCNPELIADYGEFSLLLNRLKGEIRFIEKDIITKNRRLTCIECQRLDESLVCFENYSYYAAVVMAVSAVENRIIEVIKRKNKGLYDKVFYKFTLGQLIQVFDTDKYKEKRYKRIKALMPEKHKPLVALLNQYRIFSVHPKEQIISSQIAEAILHLSFSFMIDAEMCPYNAKELKCK